MGDTGDTERLRALFRSLPGLAVLVFDHDLRITMALGSLQVVGQTGDVVGRALEELVPVEAAEPVVACMRGALAGATGDLELRMADEPDELWLAEFAPLTGGDGEIIGGVAAARRITRQRRAEWAQRERNLRLEGLRRMATELAGGHVDEALQLAVSLPLGLVGASTGVVVVPADLPGRLLVRAVEGEHVERLRGGDLPVGDTLIGGVFERGEPRIVDQAAAGAETTPSSTALEFGSVLLYPLIAEKRHIGVLAFARDPERPPFSEHDLELVAPFADQAAIALEHERTLMERNRLALLEERERIARELHDGVIQMLYSTGLELQAIAQLATSAEVARRSEAVVDRLDESIRELRAYIFALRPALLTGHPFDQVLEQQVKQFERVSGIVTVLEADQRVIPALEAVAGDVLQVVRESLSNVRRHANATTCRVTLRMADDGGLLVEIDDDGQGMRAGWEADAGQGIRNLRERAERLGGRVEVTSVPGEGTLVTLQVPPASPPPELEVDAALPPPGPAGPEARAGAGPVSIEPGSETGTEPGAETGAGTGTGAVAAP